MEGVDRLSAEPAAQLLVPAAVVPVTPHVGGLVGDYYQVEGPGKDHQLTSGTEIFLPGGVGLDGGDGHVEKIAHAMTASMARTATTTMMMSTMVLWCSRNGLKPTPKR